MSGHVATRLVSVLTLNLVLAQLGVVRRRTRLHHRHSIPSWMGVTGSLAQLQLRGSRLAERIRRARGDNDSEGRKPTRVGVTTDVDVNHQSI
jgi:hypothetical protein